MFCIQHVATEYVEVGCDAVDALVVTTRVELAHMSPFFMDTASALAIGGAMLTAMAVAWVLRMIRLSLGAVNSAEGS